MGSGEEFSGYATVMCTLLSCCGLLAVDRAGGQFDRGGKGARLLGLADRHPVGGRPDRQGQDPGQPLVTAGVGAVLGRRGPALLLRPSFFLGIVFSLLIL